MCNGLKASIDVKYMNKGCGVETWDWDSFCLHFLCHRDPFRAHREHMRQMMRSFSEPFGGPLTPSIMDGRRRGRDLEEHPRSSRALREEHRVRTCISRSTPFTICVQLVYSSSRQQSLTQCITVQTHDWLAYIHIMWDSVGRRICSYR